MILIRQRRVKVLPLEPLLKKKTTWLSSKIEPIYEYLLQIFKLQKVIIHHLPFERFRLKYSASQVKSPPRPVCSTGGLVASCYSPGICGLICCLSGLFWFRSPRGVHRVLRSPLSLLRPTLAIHISILKRNEVICLNQSASEMLSCAIWNDHFFPSKKEYYQGLVFFSLRIMTWVKVIIRIRAMGQKIPKNICDTYITSFSVAPPQLWNDMPLEIRWPTDFDKKTQT